MKTPLLSLILALFVAAGTSAAAPPQGADGPSASRVASAVDDAVRWLRGHWDLESGAYGGVLETAEVLRALHQSPRAYRYTEGPFVSRAVDFLVARQDERGWIQDPGSEEAAGREASAAARQALLLFARAPGVEAALARLEGAGFREGALPLTRPGDAGEARRFAAALLAEQREDGSFGDPEGTVVHTARAILALSGAHADLAEAQAQAAPAAQALPLPPFSKADHARAAAAIERAAGFLAGQALRPGVWGVGRQEDTGISAMVLTCLLALPEPRPEAVQTQIDAGLARLRAIQREDGSIHDGRMPNYVTSASVMALAKAGLEEDRPRLLRARAFLQSLQADESQGYEVSHRYYGGIGYGNDERPDLSNLQLALEALAATGLDSEDQTFQRALVFLERTQNRSESNTLVIEEDGVVIRSGDDGGAAYAPGESKAGMIELPDGTQIPRSYGSMTYALLRGYLFAGLSREDPRVQAAWGWLTRNYTLDVNPGFEASSDPAAPFQGLFYYFYSMAKALDAYGEEYVVDEAGEAHPWRSQLAGRIVAMQRPDGSWRNDNSPRWWEGNPVLATAYAVLVLDTARPPQAEAETEEPAADEAGG